VKPQQQQLSIRSFCLTQLYAPSQSIEEGSIKITKNVAICMKKCIFLACKGMGSWRGKGPKIRTGHQTYVKSREAEDKKKKTQKKKKKLKKKRVGYPSKCQFSCIEFHGGQQDIIHRVPRLPAGYHNMRLSLECSIRLKMPHVETC